MHVFTKTNIQKLITSVLLTLIVIVSTTTHIVKSQTNDFIIDQKINYKFGEFIEIQGTLLDPSIINKVSLILTSTINTSEISIIKEGNIRSNNATFLLDPNDLQSLQAFSSINYKFVAEFNDGVQKSSDEFTHFYQDNRFEWKQLDNDQFTVHWFQGEIAFGQEILTAAQNTIPAVDKIIPLDQLPEKIDIYIYQNQDQLVEALAFGNSEWVAGHANPHTNRIFTTISPDPNQIIAINRQIPHEVSHILIANIFGGIYTDFPTWLNEGIASHFEFFGLENPDNNITLQTAFDNNSLIPLENLCEQFPQNSNQISTAYAQSASYVNFIIDTYGTEAIVNLVNSYAAGASCENGLITNLNLDFESFQSTWHAYALGKSSAGETINAGESFPWFVLLVLTFVLPIGIQFLKFFLSRAN